MWRGIWSFLVCGVVGLSLGTFLAVTSFALPSERLNSWVMRVWARSILRAAGIKLIVEGNERIPGHTPCFFVGNHQSAMDIPIIVSAQGGHVRFLAKDSLFRIPLFGWAMARSGNVAISRSRPRVTLERLEKMLNRVREYPVSLVVFPEGTRSPNGRLLPFRKGTMKICQRAGFTIVPFAVSGSLAIHERGRMIVNPGTVTLRFADPIRTDELSDLSAEQLRSRVFEAVASCLGVSYAMSGAAAS